ncbi:YceI family protein (plasmid) [Emticicia oligotrophica DSM 17448]|uniref:YceI family protein n=1 Tax=Emticicia oligotrophica (strain DSM 17448 / CIP 109782 / MTCC 6937 / GPTSA100-15) TaxID=929562 RepID=A0ABM5N7J6_EMTOG|nr:YceI family protein [Emticicia oligotrophica]AFK05502.1 YceI family protein [Emticicia oligotrophica DSM 17448]
MKRIINLTFVALTIISMSSFILAGKLVSNKTHIKFFSHTPAEDIEANNYKAVSTIEPSTGDVVFSVPMQSFEFEKALMQKHYNSDKFLDTKQFPKAKLVGKITNLSDIHFDKDGTYNANIKGELTIKDKTNPIDEKGTVIVKGGVISVNSKFNITLAQYGVSFEKGKPSTNIGKSVEVTVHAEYAAE